MNEDRWLCMECHKNTKNKIDYYMLNTFLWRSIAKDIKGMLCVSCVENKIGHTITKSDLLNCPLNWDHPIFGKFYKESEYA
jgi:hypothetical protein